METALHRLPGLLLPWYDEHHRVLPWRADREPYHVWLSEIMLQQTRVEAVKGYYLRFLEALPTVEALAQCDDDRLHKLWEGLGYYSRVRNLKKAAQVIADTYGGVFPQNYEQILALPGVGEYTAGAIASIAFGIPVPAVDGNVLRVLSRLQNDASPIDDPKVKVRLRQQLSEIYPPQAGEFTQALMELGATLCGPNRSPNCSECPCREICLGCQAGTAEQLPVKTPKKPRKIEERTVWILSCQGAYALEKRPAKGLLAGLWQFPNVPGFLSPQQAVDLLAQWDISVETLHKKLRRSHIFTHIEWQLEGLYFEVSSQSPRFRWLTPAEIEADAALPTAFRQFWEATDQP